MEQERDSLLTALRLLRGDQLVTKRSRQDSNTQIKIQESRNKTSNKTVSKQTYSSKNNQPRNQAEKIQRLILKTDLI